MMNSCLDSNDNQQIFCWHILKLLNVNCFLSLDRFWEDRLVISSSASQRYSSWKQIPSSRQCQRISEVARHSYKTTHHPNKYVIYLHDLHNYFLLSILNENEKSKASKRVRILEAIHLFATQYAVFDNSRRNTKLCSHLFGGHYNWSYFQHFKMPLYVKKSVHIVTWWLMCCRFCIGWVADV